jgi:uncharacterized protein YidB (DUF937 family)
VNVITSKAKIVLLALVAVTLPLLAVWQLSSTSVAGASYEQATSEVNRQDVGVTQIEQEEKDNEEVDEELDEENYPDPFEIAAKTIVIDVETLFDELDGGKSVAEVAEANGVEAQTVIDALVQAENAFIDELEAKASLPSEGEISAEEAAEWRAEVTTEITELVNETDWDEEDFFFEDEANGTLPSEEDFYFLEKAAEVIGIDEEALFSALEDGQTIAEVAQANGVEAQTVIDALLDAENAFIDELEAAGDVTAEEAAEWRAEVPTDTAEFVNEGGWDEFFFEEEGVDFISKAAEVIGIDEEALFSALEDGQTIADVAQANGASAQAVIDALVEAENAFIDELEAAGELTAEEAAEWRAEVPTYTAEFVNESEWDEFFECDDEHEEGVDVSYSL